MAKKGVFVDALEDIDDIMPAPPPRVARQAEAPEPNAAANATETADEPLLPAAPAEVAVRPRTAPPRRRRPAGTVPTAEVEPKIKKKLRRLTTQEKTGNNPTSGRTYAQVVLDAIEENQEELSKHWKTTSTGAHDGGGGLFSRLPAQPARRRRHAEPPARVPLTGLNPSDVQVLDDLVEKWSAPSRSALVEQALRLYL